MLPEQKNARAGAQLIVVTGGCRSGKSEFAESLFPQTGMHLFYVATARATEEMQERIASHRLCRGCRWQTFEIPERLERFFRDFGQLWREGGILVDSMGIWTANLLLSGGDSEHVLHECAVVLRAAKNLIEKNGCRIVFVTDEVGWGVTPPTRLGNIFRDTMGKVNQLLAKNADAAILMSCGCPLPLKGTPEQICL